MKALEIAGRFDKRAKNLEAVPGFEDLDFLVRDRDYFLQAAAELRRLAEVEAELERIKAMPPVAWLVLSTNQDGSISVEYVAEWPEAAHEHINDAISEHDDKEAASWVVRPVIYALGSKT